MTDSSYVRWIVAVWLLASSGFVDAADSTWIGTTDALWSTTTNWDPSAPTSADRAIFNGGGNGNTTIDLSGTGQSTLGILFTSSNAAAYTIGSGGVNAQTLTLAATGTIAVDSTVVTNQLFNAAIRLGDATTGSYTFQNNDLNNLLTFSGSVAGGTGGVAGAKTLVVAGSGSTTIAGVIANGGATSLGLTKSGAGTLTLSASNSYTGATTVSAGVVNIASGGSINSGGGIVTVANGASNATLSINGGAVTSATPMSIGGASGTGAGVVTINSGALTASAEIYVGSNNASAGYGALLINGGTVTTASWLAIGRGSAAGTADTRGLLQMTGGSLNVGGLGNLAIGAFQLNTAATSVMAISGGTAAASANVYAGENLSGILDVSGGRVQTGAGNSVRLRNVNNAGTIGFLNLRGGTVATGAVSTAGASGTSIFNFNGGTLEALQSNATFMQGLTQANVFAGNAAINTNGFNITIGQSLLAASGTGLSTIAFTGGTGYVAPPIVNISGGGGTGATALATVDSNGNLTGITVTNPGTGYTSNPTITLSGGGGSGATIGAIGLATNTSGGLAKTGAGTLTLTGSNTYTGTTNIRSGTLQIGSGGTAGAISPSSVITGSAGGTLAFNRTDMLTQGTNFNSVIGGAIGVTQLGSGTLVLNGANTYTGATTVSAGAINVASGASINGGGGIVTVANGASNATLSINGGAVTSASTGPMFIGGGGGTGAGVVTVNSGVLTANNEIYVGSNPTSANYGALIINGGTVTTSNYLALGRGVGGGTADTRGLLQMTGGSLNVNGGNLAIGTFQAANTARSVMTLSGGTATVTNNVAVGEWLSGNLDVSGGRLQAAGVALKLNNTSGFGILNLRGGVIATNSVFTGAATGTSIFNFNGGTLEARQTNATFMQGLTQANVFAGGAAINTNGFNITIAQNLLAASGTGLSTIAFTGGTGYVAPPIVNITGGGGTEATALATVDANGNLTGITVTNPGTGYTSNPTVTLSGGGGSGATIGAIGLAANTSGGLAKTGAGTLTLTGANTFTGTTNISSGTLQIGSGGTAGAISPSSVITGSAGGTLAFNRSDTYGGTFGNTIGGGIGLTLNSGTLTLSGSNTFSGTTRLIAGALTVGNTNALQSSTLDMNGTDAGTVTFSQDSTLGGLTGSRNLDMGTRALTIGGNGQSTTYSGVLSNGTLTKTGTGALTLSGVNTFSGNITIDSGTLVAAARGAGDGTTGGLGNVMTARTITVNSGGALSFTAADVTGNAAFVPAATLVVNGGSVFSGATVYNSLGPVTLTGGTITTLGGNGALYGGFGLQRTVTVTASSTTSVLASAAGANSFFNLLGSGTFDVADGDAATDLLVSGNIGGQTNVGLTKVGAGTMELSGSNTYTSTTLVSAGTLRFSGTSTGLGNLVLNGASALVTVAGGQTTINSTLGNTYVIGGSTLEIAGGALTLQGGNTWFSVGNNGQGSGNGTLTVTSGSFTSTNQWGITVASATGTINVNGGVFTANGAGNNGIILGENAAGNGTLNLNGGTLITDQIRGGAGVGAVNFNGGKLQATGDVVDVFASNARLTATILSGGLTVGGTPSFTMSQGLTGTGGLTKVDANTLTLSGSNSFTGATRVGGGGLAIANANALQNSTLDMNAADSGTVSFSQNSTLGGLSGSRNLDMGTRTLTIGGNGQSTTYSGGLSNGAVTKLGSGTLTLSGSNGYTGTTTVSAGTLVVNGSLANASLTVASGATLMGTGTIAGLTTIAGMHLPGNSPGVETFTNLTYNSGASVQWELWGNTAATPPTAYDQVVVNGNLTFSGATRLDLVFTGSAGPSSFSSVSWANAFWDSNQEWLLYDVAGTLATANNLTLNVTNWQDSTGAFFQTARPNASFSVEQRASDVYIVYAAVPEPGTLVLAGIGVAAIVALRRRRRAAA